MAGPLAGRTALVTGAAGGIGREIVRGMLEAGASIVAADVSDRGLAEVAKLHANQGDRLVTRYLDIADRRAAAAAVAAAEDRFGAVDILINNGALGMGAIREDHFTELVGIEEIEPEVWDRFVAVNFSGAWYLTRAVVPGMKQRGWGRIINVTTSMFTMLRGRFHPYGPSKAALEAMSAGHAQEFAGTGITVNVVVPGGPADTPMVPASAGFERGALIPPAQMLLPMLWLCSPEADAVTGNRYVAAHWPVGADAATARKTAEAPAGWPSLAQAPVWPGGKPGA
jgi:NAD(P)-dependent dehydrogenase (short-subunit alcohol dehydrogenase family)